MSDRGKEEKNGETERRAGRREGGCERLVLGGNKWV